MSSLRGEKQNRTQNSGEILMGKAEGEKQNRTWNSVKILKKG